ncbi:hypothetical protein HYH03_010750 [Edaphochlamys debaryana]|uniref:Uncharacterized protein n=1 Tax=Edaphochlamys debaryana TaxID=47281 RepID=A0A835XW01_9CHLO|nr:hypothetical protein HYH03_010750 [Edaphochlamys debaryana]|eukprot:KAG2490829.1 hypothetical protein HYH03_010750 [Edaphochlamys debaryana]
MAYNLAGPLRSRPGRRPASCCETQQTRGARRAAVTFPLVRPGSIARRSRDIRASASSSEAGGAEQPSTSGSPVPEQAYLSWCEELVGLSASQLREAAFQRPELLDSPFLFWLRDRERRAGVPAAERAQLERLGGELTAMREWTEERSNRTLLPSLASSLAYSNLKKWREETGSVAPEVAKGVRLEDLYRLGEEEERKLRDSLEGGGGAFGMGPRREQQRSSIEEFTKYNKAYADLAAGAMARVRSRLMGFDDDGPSAAASVLEALLSGMGSAEERATYLPGAFTPPGLQVGPPPGSTGAGGRPSYAVTTPQELLAVARERLQAITAADAGAAAATPASPAPSSSSLHPEDAKLPPWRPKGRAATPPPEGSPASGPAPSSPTASAPSPPGASPSPARPRVLPSGEPEAEALADLVALAEEYERAVYSHKSPLERLGHTQGPWNR